MSPVAYEDRVTPWQAVALAKAVYDASARAVAREGLLAHRRAAVRAALFATDALIAVARILVLTRGGGR